MRKATFLPAAVSGSTALYAQSAPVKSVFAQNVEAVSSLAWPVLALVIFCILYPQIKNIIRSRNFSIKVAGMEVNVQNMADQLGEQIHELQKKAVELECAVKDTNPEQREERLKLQHTARENRRILWVTGRHESHAFEIGYLEKDGVEVIRAHSTREALEILNEQKETIDAVVTGVSRRESKNVNPQAGLDLMRKIKDKNYGIPVFVMCSEKSIRDYYEKLIAAGAVHATSSSLDLIAFLEGALNNCTVPKEPGKRTPGKEAAGKPVPLD